MPYLPHMTCFACRAFVKWSHKFCENFDGIWDLHCIMPIFLWIFTFNLLIFEWWSSWGFFRSRIIWIWSRNHQQQQLCRVVKMSLRLRFYFFFNPCMNCEQNKLEGLVAPRCNPMNLKIFIRPLMYKGLWARFDQALFLQSTTCVWKPTLWWKLGRDAFERIHMLLSWSSQDGAK